MKSIEDYNGDWKRFILTEFLQPAIKYDIGYEEFWKLTPVTLNYIMKAKNEKLKEEMELQDIYNWQLGQYYCFAIADALSKGGNIYPDKPLFTKIQPQEQLSKAQEELETLKFKEFFGNLGSYVKIKKKGG